MASKTVRAAMAPSDVAWEKRYLGSVRPAAYFTFRAKRKERFSAVFPNVEYTKSQAAEAALRRRWPPKPSAREAPKHHRPGGDLRNGGKRAVGDLVAIGRKSAGVQPKQLDFFNRRDG